MPQGVNFDFKNLIKFLDSDDIAVRQAAILTLASHKVSKAYPKIESFLSSPEMSIKYSSAISLIHVKSQRALPVVIEILEIKEPKGFTSEQILGLKINALQEIQKVKWIELKNKVEELSKNEENLIIKAKALEVLKHLNN
jgi:HEAT repeat protein